MDKELLKRYFRNQCTLDEIEQVLDWFQTKEGQQYFAENLDRDMHKYADDDRLLLDPDVPSESLLKRIQQSKQRVKSPLEKKNPIWQRKLIAAVIVCALLAGAGFFIFQSEINSSSTIHSESIRTITTLDDQHRLVTLSDGTKIRLNSNSTIKIPNPFASDKRNVTLNGEAWFDVAHEENRPFHIQAGQATIDVLGTEFNVKMDDIAGNVQVAVAEGRVSLNNSHHENGSSAILTQNTYAVYNIDSREILIEHTPVENYMSWISGKLFFYNEPLWVVSRYIERLYDVSFQFNNESLKELPLSTNMARENLPDVLNIIAQTLGIDYTLENNTVTWNDNINPKTPK